MALEIDPSSKIQLRSRGDLMPPGKCAVCGSSDPERSYVDFGLWYDYEGGIYICLDFCFKQAVEALGFFTREEVEQNLAQTQVLLNENDALKRELENARPILDALANFSSPPTFNASSSDGSSDSDILETPVSGTTGEPEVKESATSTGERSDTSGSEPRNRSKPVIV